MSGKRKAPSEPSREQQARRRESRRDLRAFMRYDIEYEPAGRCRCVRYRRGASNSADGKPNVGAVAEVVAGPFKGDLGYIDDRASVELESNADECASRAYTGPLLSPEGR
jgi:hypothetical protein